MDLRSLFDLALIGAVVRADRSDGQKLHFNAWTDQRWWLEKKPARGDVASHRVANRSQRCGQGSQWALAEMIREVGHRRCGVGVSRDGGSIPYLVRTRREPFCSSKIGKNLGACWLKNMRPGWFFRGYATWRCRAGTLAVARCFFRNAMVSTPWATDACSVS